MQKTLMEFNTNLTSAVFLNVSRLRQCGVRKRIKLALLRSNPRPCSGGLSLRSDLAVELQQLQHDYSNYTVICGLAAFAAKRARFHEDLNRINLLYVRDQC
jgi:hypothetical protein